MEADGSNDGGTTGEAPDGDPVPDSSVERPRFWYVRDVGVALGTVVLAGVLLIAVSGVVSPLVAIESGSMEPQMERGDMVFLMAEERFPGPNATHGVVTAESSGYERFGRPGDVIVFAPDGDTDRTPIIHRAMFAVEAGEDWYDRADPEYRGSAGNCTSMANCPAPHDGFVTLGDANGRYDQVAPTKSTVVRPRWVIGTAEFRVPELGWVRV
jgi:signal peptidase